MRWVMLAAGLLVAGLLAVSYAPVRSVLQGAEEEALPELRASRSTLTESTVAIGTVKPKVGAEVKVGDNRRREDGLDQQVVLDITKSMPGVVMGVKLAGAVAGADLGVDQEVQR